MFLSIVYRYRYHKLALSLVRSKNECSTKKFGYENAKRVNAFHKSFPEYGITPLAELSELAKYLGLESIHVKDESFRFGLNAFKVLGGSFAIGSYIAKNLGMNIANLPYERMIAPEIKSRLGDITFVTATDGNHGRGVAWTANRLNQRSVVYMPKGSSSERLDNIKALGSDASITELNYDDAVRLANENAKKYGWVVVQDTDWEGYTEIPTWIMQGYTTMAYEAVQQLQEKKAKPPTHIFLQAGVGAMSGAIAGFYADLYGDGPDAPIITIIEPEKADCIYRTAKANDGKLYFAEGNMDTIMAGLACGEPCLTGWNILRNHANHFAIIPENIAAKGMRILGNPLPNDPIVISGESGAVTLAFVAEVMQNPKFSNIRKELNLDRDSRIFCFSTEGDTDRKSYRRIVWDGEYASI